MARLGFERHDQSRLAGSDARRLPTVVTHPRVSLNPLSAQDADSFIESWLTAPATWVPPAGEGTLAAYRFLATRHSISGNLVPDPMLAALALENGVPVVSADSDFSRFREVAWLNPLRT